MRKIVITESEKKQILSKHLQESAIDLDNVVITDWLSPDERYVIFLDELYDLENKSKLGDVWKNPDNLILFLEHTYRVSNLRTDIKEGAAEVFNKRILSESSYDLTQLKPIIKQYLNEAKNVWNYFTDWLGNTAKDTVTGITNFTTDLVKGGANIGSAVLQGDFAKVWDLLKQGVKWLGRKIRQAVYSPVGIIIDTILMATGIGKVPQAVVWAIVVCVDIYEFVTGDYEHKDEPMWLRIVFALIDVLGLVTAGAAAKAARVAVKAATAGAHSAEGLAKAAMKSPTLRKVFESCLAALKKLPSKLAEAGSMLGKGHFGKLFKMAMTNVASFVKYVLESLKSTFKNTALRPILVNTGLVAGLGTGVEYLKDVKKEKEELTTKEKEEEEKAYEELGVALADKDVNLGSLLKPA